MDKWITRYSWTPLYSENIDNIFYSIDQRNASIYGCIYNNISNNYGIRTDKHEADESGMRANITLAPDTSAFNSDFTVTLNSITTAYADDNDHVYNIEIPDLTHNLDLKNCPISINNKTVSVGSLEELKNYFSPVSSLPPVYYILNVTVTIKINEANVTFDDNIGIICNYESLSED